MKRDKILKFLKRQWILIWLVSAVLALTAVVSFSEYKNDKRMMKRVFVTSARQTELFTSNYLTKNGDSKVSYFGDPNAASYQTEVILRNYHVSDRNTRHPEDISYTLYAKLVGNIPNDATVTLSRGNDSLVLTKNDPEKTTAKSFTMSKDEAVSHKWDVTFENIPLDSDCSVELEARSNAYNISATLRIALNPIVHVQGWSGTFSDLRTAPFGNYDAFNYTISGTGQKWLYFSYDPTVLEINPAFAALNDDVTEVDNDKVTFAGYEGQHTGWKVVEIAANPDLKDASDTQIGVNRYDFQLYKVAGYSSAHITSFDDLEAYVDLYESAEDLTTSVQNGGEEEPEQNNP